MGNADADANLFELTEITTAADDEQKPEEQPPVLERQASADLPVPPTTDTAVDSPAITLLLPNLAQKRREQRAQAAREAEAEDDDDNDDGLLPPPRPPAPPPAYEEEAPPPPPPYSPVANDYEKDLLLKDLFTVMNIQLNELRAMRTQIHHLFQKSEHEQRAHQFLLSENSQLRRRQIERKELAAEINAQQQSVLHREIEAVRQHQQHIIGQQAALLRALRVFATAFQLGGPPNGGGYEQPFF